MYKRQPTVFMLHIHIDEHTREVIEFQYMGFYFKCTFISTKLRDKNR